MGYVIVKNGERVRFAETMLKARIILKFIPGAEVIALSMLNELPHPADRIYPNLRSKRLTSTYTEEVFSM